MKTLNVILNIFKYLLCIVYLIFSITFFFIPISVNDMEMTEKIFSYIISFLMIIPLIYLIIINLRSHEDDKSTNIEYILCAAYKFKDKCITPNMQRILDETGQKIEDMYYTPHKEVFNMALGWRHPDILYKYGDAIDKDDSGGFITSLGRYVEREEAAEIAYKAGQIKEQKRRLFSEDLY